MSSTGGPSKMSIVAANSAGKEIKMVMKSINSISMCKGFPNIKVTASVLDMINFNNYKFNC